MFDLSDWAASESDDKAKYFNQELRPGIFLIGLDQGGSGVDGQAIQPGHATSNSYLVVGREKALLLDSMANVSGFRAYAEQLAKVPVMFALTHAHLDHVCRLCEFDQFWIHQADEELLRGAHGMPIYPKIPAGVHYLQDGDVIDLGGRLVDVFNIRGHTMGSLLFLDRTTKTLISGDTIARRLLYGISGWVSPDEFIRTVLALARKEFDGILSAHDRFVLPKSHIRYLIETFCQTGSSNKLLSLLGVDMIQSAQGDENEIEYQDVTIPALFCGDVQEALRKLTDLPECGDKID